jgi:hypothetical protein
VSASNAIVYCPLGDLVVTTLTDKPMSVKDIHVERTLVTFLRRFFPAALKGAPAQLVSDNVPVDVDVKPQASMGIVGMLSALKSKKGPQQECNVKVAPSRRQLRTSALMRPPSFELDKLNQEVSSILKDLATPVPSSPHSKEQREVHRFVDARAPPPPRWPCHLHALRATQPTGPLPG